jgi:hypothetical protein
MPDGTWRCLQADPVSCPADAIGRSFLTATRPVNSGLVRHLKDHGSALGWTLDYSACSKTPGNSVT